MFKYFVIFLILGFCVLFGLQDARNIGFQVASDNSYWRQALQVAAKSNMTSSAFLAQYSDQARVVSTNLPLVQLRKDIELSSFLCPIYIIGIDYSFASEGKEKYWNLTGGGSGLLCLGPKKTHTYSRSVIQK